MRHRCFLDDRRTHLSRGAESVYLARHDERMTNVAPRASDFTEQRSAAVAIISAVAARVADPDHARNPGVAKAERRGLPGCRSLAQPCAYTSTYS